MKEIVVFVVRVKTRFGSQKGVVTLTPNVKFLKFHLTPVTRSFYTDPKCPKEAMKLYLEAISLMEDCFHELEKSIPPPTLVDLGSCKAYKYTDKKIEAAIIQKLARVISGLNASAVLLANGYVQELGVIFRTLDELIEDISFLCQPMLGKEFTSLHQEYLEEFYQEEFDNPDNAILSTQKRARVSRKKILAALSNTPENGLNPSDSKELLRTISQAYSGYVHGASGHILEMYAGGSYAGYHLRGMRGTPRMQEFHRNLWDYVYRGLHAVILVAISAHKDEMKVRLFKFRESFEERSGITGKGDPESEMKKAKKKGTNK